MTWRWRSPKTVRASLLYVFSCLYRIDIHAFLVLKQLPNDLDALHSKLIALIQLARFEDAQKFLEARASEERFTFERAYVLYRLKRLPEALKILSALSGAKREPRVLHLEAQIVRICTALLLAHLLAALPS